MNSIQDFRSFYARYVVSNLRAADERLIAAFASVERERYVGAGPWKVGTIVSGYVDTIVDDPRILYQDMLVALKPEHHINNGQPSLHALCLAACYPKPGDSVLHLGAGTGYYTAILAQLAGPDGKILAYEIDPELAGLARRNLSHLPRVKVIAASGCNAALPESDVIYINAAATQPMAVWLDAMKIGARLIFPLTPSGEAGCMLLITRGARAEYGATALSGASFTPCIGAVDKVMSEVLATAFAKRPVRLIKSLRRNNRVDDTVWCRGDGWWLSTGEPAE